MEDERKAGVWRLKRREEWGGGGGGGGGGTLRLRSARATAQQTVVKHKQERREDLK